MGHGHSHSGNIELTKTVISNQRAQELYDSKFNEVIISAEKIDDEKLIKIYEELFYRISKRGKSSHEEIIIKSDSIIHPEININYDSQIQQLENNITDKNEELLNLGTPKEHPIFTNGIFIQEGDVINKVPTGDQIWFIQEGYKRQVNSISNLNIIINALGYNNPIPAGTGLGSDASTLGLLDSPFFQLATPEDINSILEAQDLTTGLDISASPLIAKDEQDAVYSQLKVEFECFGIERWYTFSEEEKQELNTEENGYWYLDTDGYCELQYQTDTDPSETFLPKTTTLSFSPIDGRYKQRRISRDPSLYLGDPLSSDFYNTPQNTFSDLRSPDTLSTYYPPVVSVKEWDFENKFPAVTYVKPGSRIKVKIMTPTLANGNPIHQGWMILNGIDTLKQDQQDIFKFFEKNSNRGTKMINNICYGPSSDICYGKFNQNYLIQNVTLNTNLMKMFSDPNSNYYRKEKQFTFGNKKIKGRIYGQPILKVQGKLAVYLGGYRRSIGVNDWNVFYNLEDNTSIRIKNRNLDNDVEGYSRQSVPNTETTGHLRYFHWLNPDRNNDGSFKDGIINNPKLMYPGLSIHNLNGSEWYNGDKGQDYTDLSSDPVYKSDVLKGTGYNQTSVRTSNLFNPSEPNGSNFELTQWVKDHIDFITFSGGNTNIPQNTTGPEGAEWSYEDGFTGGGQEGSPQILGSEMDEGGFS